VHIPYRGTLWMIDAQRWARWTEQSRCAAPPAENRRMERGKKGEEKMLAGPSSPFLSGIMHRVQYQTLGSCDSPIGDRQLEVGGGR